ncbi:MAG: lysophospholipid acyltransferase family protein [Candidatus Fermentibacter sp.]|nr:lysophospholipid acyltransferase family protein [Candidatus Fermentibacter sp.]
MSDGPAGTKEKRLLRPTFRHLLEYAALRAVVLALDLMPLRMALCFGAAIGRAAWILGIRRKVSLINLGQAFPDLPVRARAEIGARSYANFGRFTVEFARQRRLGRRHIEKYVRIENPGIMKRLGEEGGIGLAFHFGNWELQGVLQSYGGVSTRFLVGRQHNALVDGFVNRLRSVHGIGLISRDGAMREIFRTIREKGVVAWLSDQDAGRGGIVVDFFGMPASTPRGAAAFAVKLGCPIYPTFMVREHGPYHTAVYTEPILPRKDIPADQAEIELTQLYTRRLEDMVRRRPDLYWWPHRRWKTTGLYARKGREAG